MPTQSKQNFNKGYIHVITGCMFSGKTDELIRLLRRHEFAEENALVFHPAKDTRGGIGGLLSRSGTVHSSTPVNSVTDVDWWVERADPAVVAFDEAQFFDDYLPVLAETLADYGIIVYVSGLDRDFLGRPFGPMPNLLALADTVTKLTAICTVCKGEATRTQRLIDGKPAGPDDPLVMIGGIGDNTYEARCREHWQSG